MIPFKAEVFGYKRLEEVRVMLDKNLIAFVGPNEAGKSSFFDALLSLETTNKPYELRELTKDFERTHDVVISVEYLIDKDERKLLQTNFNGIGKPRFYKISKELNGNLHHEIIGNITRNTKERQKFLKLISDLLKRKRLGKELNDMLCIDEHENEISSFDFLFSLKGKLNEDIISEEVFQTISEIMEDISSIKSNVHSSDKKILDEILEQYKVFLEFENSPHPKAEFLNYLSSNRPQFLEFSNAERQLKGFYPINELKQKPVSIVNLLELAEINIEDIIDSIENKNDLKRFELKKKANKILEHKFTSSWTQSNVFPVLEIEINSLKVIIESNLGLNELRDRSDGLRQYIAMRAFLEKRANDIKPILLIDEAEIHLHYQAQANLVMDFEKQNIVNSIFYTTHSAGCLPSDLGTGVRVVEPIYIDDIDTGRSVIKNSIWENNGGFSPLLLAMGANVIAFTPARKGLIAEGPSETILLPRILREALKKDFLDFQVAPGIATISKERVKSFELEAAKEAYIVDGDAGGDNNKRKLIEGGILESKIIQLPKKFTLEDFINPILLVNSIKEEFRCIGIDFPRINFNKLPNSNRIGWIQKQCKNSFPSKTRIAKNIISDSASDETIIDKKRISEIKEIYKRITNVFES